MENPFPNFEMDKFVFELCSDWIPCSGDRKLILFQTWSRLPNNLLPLSCNRKTQFHELRPQSRVRPGFRRKWITARGMRSQIKLMKWAFKRLQMEGHLPRKWKSTRAKNTTIFSPSNILHLKGPDSPWALTPPGSVSSWKTWWLKLDNFGWANVEKVLLSWHRVDLPVVYHRPSCILTMYHLHRNIVSVHSFCPAP